MMDVDARLAPGHGAKALRAVSLIAAAGSSSRWVCWHAAGVQQCVISLGFAPWRYVTTRRHVLVLGGEEVSRMAW